MAVAGAFNVLSLHTDEEPQMSLHKSCRLALVVTAALLIAAPAQAQHRPDERHHPRFDDPAKWSKSFDDPARDQWQMPERIIATLALPQTAVVADIGAGTGYFAARLARHLKDGIVYAADVETAMVQHLGERAKANGLSNLRPVQAGETSANLPEPVDVAILLNVYHHIDKRPDYFKRLRASLKPGGLIAIVDYRLDAPNGPPKHMRMSAERIVAEMASAGYRVIATHDFLPRQYFIVLQTKD
jgi:predicted methyltransferase